MREPQAAVLFAVFIVSGLWRRTCACLYAAICIGVRVFSIVGTFPPLLLWTRAGKRHATVMISPAQRYALSTSSLGGRAGFPTSPVFTQRSPLPLPFSRKQGKSGVLSGIIFLTAFPLIARKPRVGTHRLVTLAYVKFHSTAILRELAPSPNDSRRRGRDLLTRDVRELRTLGGVATVGIALRSASGTKFSSGVGSYGSHPKPKTRFLDQTFTSEEVYRESRTG